MTAVGQTSGQHSPRSSPVLSEGPGATRAWAQPVMHSAGDSWAPSGQESPASPAPSERGPRSDRAFHGTAERRAFRGRMEDRLRRGPVAKTPPPADERWRTTPHSLGVIAPPGATRLEG